MLQMIQRYMEPNIWNFETDSIAIDAIKEVGHTGHYFGIQHTQNRYEEAFYEPFVSDWRNFEAWYADGEKHTLPDDFYSSGSEMRAFRGVLHSR